MGEAREIRHGNKPNGNEQTRVMGNTQGLIRSVTDCDANHCYRWNIRGKLSV